MTPTTGNWMYNPDFCEVQTYVGTRTLATIVGSQEEPESEAEAHANGYLMAAAPNLRDELSNLSRAVRGYFETREHGSEDDLLIDENEMEVMLRRAERALETIFPLKQQ